MRNLLWLRWYQEQGVKQDHEDLLECLDHKVQVVAREFQERLEIQDQWVNQDIEDLMGHRENLDLMENLDLQALQESQDFQDLRVQEVFQDFQVYQD